MSTGSPTISDSIIAATSAGAHIFANLPPFTEESLLRTVFISTISAEHAISWADISLSSSKGTSGFSNSALPPPETRKSTVSPAPAFFASSIACSVAATEFSSGMGCPASYTLTRSKPPCAWPYLVITIPSSILSSSHAALAIVQAALPIATRYILPLSSSLSSAALTAACGCTAAIAASIIALASLFMPILFIYNVY